MKNASIAALAALDQLYLLIGHLRDDPSYRALRSDAEGLVEQLKELHSDIWICTREIERERDGPTPDEIAWRRQTRPNMGPL